MTKRLYRLTMDGNVIDEVYLEKHQYTSGHEKNKVLKELSDKFGRPPHYFKFRPATKRVFVKQNRENKIAILYYDGQEWREQKELT